jgi:hypothetical protein
MSFTSKEANMVQIKDYSQHNCYQAIHRYNINKGQTYSNKKKSTSNYSKLLHVIYKFILKMIPNIIAIKRSIGTTLIEGKIMATKRNQP